jgi:hypothetical protein
MVMFSAGADHPQSLTLVFCWSTMCDPIIEGKRTAAELK